MLCEDVIIWCNSDITSECHIADPLQHITNHRRHFNVSCTAHNIQTFTFLPATQHTQHTHEEEASKNTVTFHAMTNIPQGTSGLDGNTSDKYVFQLSMSKNLWTNPEVCIASLRSAHACWNILQIRHIDITQGMKGYYLGIVSKYWSDFAAAFLM